MSHILNVNILIYRLTVPEPGMMQRDHSGIVPGPAGLNGPPGLNGQSGTSCPNGPTVPQGDVGNNANLLPRRVNAGIEMRRSGPTSLFILSETNIVRRMTKFLIEWPPFEYTVLVRH